MGLHDAFTGEELYGKDVSRVKVSFGRVSMIPKVDTDRWDS